MKQSLLYLFLLLLPVAFTQSNDKPERAAFQLQLAVNDSNFYQADIEAGSYVYPDNTVQIYPGDTIYLELELKGNKLVSMKSVKAISYPEKTITLTFKQFTEGKKHSYMQLTLDKNKLKKVISYSASMFPLEYGKWAETSVIPVGAQMSFEQWPYPIVTLGLNNWSFENP